MINSGIWGEPGHEPWQRSTNKIGPEFTDALNRIPDKRYGDVATDVTSFLYDFLRRQQTPKNESLRNQTFYNIRPFVPVQYPPTPIGPGNPFDVKRFFSTGMES